MEKEQQPEDLIAWSSVIPFFFFFLAFLFWDNLNLTESYSTSRESCWEPLSPTAGKLASCVTIWPLQEPRCFW